VGPGDFVARRGGGRYSINGDPIELSCRRRRERIVTAAGFVEVQPGRWGCLRRGANVLRLRFLLDKGI